jgi:hypothetical protein
MMDCTPLPPLERVPPVNRFPAYTPMPDPPPVTTFEPVPFKELYRESNVSLHLNESFSKYTKFERALHDQVVSRLDKMQRDWAGQLKALSGHVDRQFNSHTEKTHKSILEGNRVLQFNMAQKIKECAVDKRQLVLIRNEMKEMHDEVVSMKTEVVKLASKVRRSPPPAPVPVLRCQVFIMLNGSVQVRIGYHLVEVVEHTTTTVQPVQPVFTKKRAGEVDRLLDNAKSMGPLRKRK